MSESASWGDRWRVIAAPGTTWVDVPRRRRDWVEQIAYMRGLEAGVAVALREPGLFGGRRCRSFARAAGVLIEREYIAFPSVAAPAFIVEDAPTSVAYFFGRIASVPPGVAALAAPAGAFLRVARVLSNLKAVRSVMGRVVLGRVA